MQLTPERQANVESGKIDILYNIVENSQSYVEQIIIQGNNRTKDKVIRRELAVAPGQIYDSVRAEQSRKRLENLQYFEKVDISPQDTTVPNRKNMVVTVEEKRTGSVTFGAGFSSVDSPARFRGGDPGQLRYLQLPLLHRWRGKSSAPVSSTVWNGRTSKLSSRSRGSWNSASRWGNQLFYHNATYLSNYYNEENYGASVSLAPRLWAFLERLDHLHGAANSISITSAVPPSPQLLREQGTRSDSSITLGMAYDTRDSVLLTRHGTHADFSGEFAGGPLLGQTNIYKFQADAQHYTLLPYDCILTLAGATGVVNYYGNSQEVPLFDRFFIGGSRSVRGFRNRDIGPVDSNNEPLGGDTMAYANAELTFPIIDRVRGARLQRRRLSRCARLPLYGRVAGAEHGGRCRPAPQSTDRSAAPRLWSPLQGSRLQPLRYREV